MELPATYSVVPFVNRRALGAVSGIVGAGGNVGAVCYAQFYLRSGAALEDCFFYFGLVVGLLGVLGLTIRFSTAVETQARRELEIAAGREPAPSLVEAGG